MAESSPTRKFSSVHDNIVIFHPQRTDPILMRLLLDRLLNDSDPIGFVICSLVVQSVSSVTDKLIFKVKLNWTGRDVKSEISRLYSIPIDCQVIIVNDRVVRDDTPLSEYNFLASEQIVYMFLQRRPVQYRNSDIRIKDILSEPENGDCEDVTNGYCDGVTNDVANDSSKLMLPLKRLELSPKSPISPADSGYYSVDIASDGTTSRSSTQTQQQKRGKKKRGKRK